jgi:CDP-glucose 4,6-dehydratase
MEDIRAIDNPSWRGRNVLVTGAGGFVGSQLALRLVQLGADVTVILRDETATSNFELLGLGDHVAVVRGSITDYPIVERAINEGAIDTCFHLAAQAIVGIANRSPMSTFESNIRGTWTILEACRTASLVKTVVAASSDKAYGSQPTLPYREDMALLASNPYDASKACTDILARSYAVSYGLAVSVARCSNIYGPGDFNLSRLIPGSIQSALAGERPILRSDGTPERDYLYVDDAVDAYLAIADSISLSKVAGEAFNFGTGDPIRAIDLMKLILQVCNAAHLEPEVRGKGSLAGEIDRQYMDCSKAASVLSWRPKVDLKEGLRRTAAWHRELLTGETRAILQR